MKSKTVKKELFNSGKWLLTYGIASMTLSGISLVYIDIYSIATLNQSVNNFGDSYFVSFYLNLLLVFLLLLGAYFTRLGMHILKKKIPSSGARKSISIALIMAFVSILPTGLIVFSFKGFSAIPVLYTAFVVLDIITIISLLRFLVKKDDETKPKKKRDYEDNTL